MTIDTISFSQELYTFSDFICFFLVYGWHFMLIFDKRVKLHWCGLKAPLNIEWLWYRGGNELVWS